MGEMKEGSAGAAVALRRPLTPLISPTWPSPDSSISDPLPHPFLGPAGLSKQGLSHNWLR